MSSKQSISVKVVIIGEPAVGKTTLRESFVGAGMEGDYLMTLGVDMAQSKIEINDNLTLDAQIWDIAGQDSLEAITNQFLAGTQGVIFVFDLTRAYTFEKINSWLDRVHEENKELENNIPFIIVGNKSDLEAHIKTDDNDVTNYMEYVNRHAVYSKTPTEYIKTSAKTGYKVKDAFQRLGEIIIKNFQELDGTISSPEVDERKKAELEDTLVPPLTEEPDPSLETTPSPMPEPEPVRESPPAPTPSPTPEPESVRESPPAPTLSPTPEPEPVRESPPAPTPSPTPEPEPVRQSPPVPTPTPMPDPVRNEKSITEDQVEPIGHKPQKRKSSGPLSNEELAELIKQKDKRKKKLFGRFFGKK